MSDLKPYGNLAIQPQPLQNGQFALQTNRNEIPGKNLLEVV